ncbi:MAG: carboxymuconolactone decarboxylase family protein [Acidimicrobiales bacterium]
MSAWLSWGGHVVRRSELSPMLRELVILRTALVAQGHYPLVQHVRIGRSVSIDDKMLAR